MKTIKIAAVGLLVVIGATACSSKISDAQEIVARDMKDPASAQFRDVEESTNGSVCGSVNAKNAFGAYTGFRAFVVPVGATQAILQPEAAMSETQQQDAVERCRASSGSGYSIEHAACDDVSKITEQLKANTAYMSAKSSNCA